MSINLAHRPDLESRVEQLADRFGLRGRGRKTAVIERALAALEESTAEDDQDELTIKASINRYIDGGVRLRMRLEKDFRSESAPLSAALQTAIYGERGLPESLRIDVSAILAILLAEEEAPLFRDRLGKIQELHV